MVPSVAIKGCSLILVTTRIPFTKPQIKTNGRACKDGSKRVQSHDQEIPTATITIASVEPTVKSIPPDDDCRVMPIARKTVDVTDWSRISSRLDQAKYKWALRTQIPP